MDILNINLPEDILGIKLEHRKIDRDRNVIYSSYIDFVLDAGDIRYPSRYNLGIGRYPSSEIIDDYESYIKGLIGKGIDISHATIYYNIFYEEHKPLAYRILIYR